MKFVFSVLLSLLTHSEAESPKFEVLVERPFPVYNTRKLERSYRIRLLQPGEKILISSQKYGPWKKLIMASDIESSIERWIYTPHMKGRSKIQQLDDSKDLVIDELLEDEVVTVQNNELPTSSFYSQGIAMGLSAHATYMKWGNRSFQLSDQTEWTVEEVTSTTYWPSLFLDLNLNEGQSLRVYGGFRTTDFKGQSSTNFIGKKQTSFLQKYFALGLIYKFHGLFPSFWWGLGGEFAQGQELIITYDNESIPAGKEDLAMFLSLFLDVGYELKLTDHFYLLPELRAGGVLNQDPNIILFEGIVSLGYLL